MRKCKFCGKNSYENFDLAREAAMRGENLDFYPCEHGNGYHLTSRSALSGSTAKALQKHGYPMAGNDWKFIEAEASNRNEKKPCTKKTKVHVQNDEVCKITPDAIPKTITIVGKVTELINKIDVGKKFHIDLHHPIGAALIKEFLAEDYAQITVIETTENRKNSYTCLITQRLATQHKIQKNDTLKITISSTSKNNVHVWCCKAVF
ncbi:MAG: hypothetical protein LBT48_06250 [Prevotellaceae bacterium]|jgi:hypothetical protein|nr:hypothetical protein [Prevotellaceae bacterium]